MRMILPVLIFGLTLCSTGAYARYALLSKLKRCQDLSEVKAIQEADAALYKAEINLGAAFDSFNTYEASCKAYGRNPTQDVGAITRIGAEGKDATTKGAAAIRSADDAFGALEKAALPVQVLGGKNCAAEMSENRTDVAMHKNYLYRKVNQLQNCINGPPAGGGGGR